MSESGRVSSMSVEKRAPKVGVYVPRHRRQPDAVTDTTFESNSSTHNSRNQQSTKSSQRDPAAVKSSNDDGPRPQQRRGHGSFKGVSTNTTTATGTTTSSESSTGGGGARTTDTNVKSKNGRDGYKNTTRTGASPFPSANTDGSTIWQIPAIKNGNPESLQRYVPRGRDFDATVLRRYSDDENRPNSTFSRSGSYKNSNSNNSNSSNSGSHSSGTVSPSSRNRPSQLDTRPRRMDQSWRIEGQQEESEDVETTLTRKLERVQISRSGSASSGSNGSAADFPTDNTRSNTTEHEFGSREGNDEDEDEDAVEEWELALDNSDEDAIPKAPAPSTKAGNKASVAAATSPSKIGNWSDVINDDMYILELYDFAPTIRTIHLTELFALFENRSGGFRIKWIDDSRALVIFESSAIAKQAYTANSSCPIARIRPYTGADKDAIRNEGKLANPAFNAPRPQKTDSVAKRLVHGALGLRVRRTPEQIAEEKALVKAAKEAREAQRQEQKRLQEERDAMFNS